MDTILQTHTCAVALNNAGVAFMERGIYDRALKCFVDATAASRLSVSRIVDANDETQNDDDFVSSDQAARQEIEGALESASRYLCMLSPKSKEEDTNPSIQVLTDTDWESNMIESVLISGPREKSNIPPMFCIRVEHASCSRDEVKMVDVEITCAVILHNLGTTKLLKSLLRLDTDVARRTHKLKIVQRSLKKSLKIVQDSQSAQQGAGTSHEDSRFIRQAVCLVALMRSLIVLFTVEQAWNEVRFYSGILSNLMTSMRQYHATVGRYVRNKRVLCASAA